MTTFREHTTAGHDDDRKLTLAEILEIFAAGRLPLRFTAYDGSSAGPEDASEASLLADAMFDDLGAAEMSPRATTTDQEAAEGSRDELPWEEEESYQRCLCLPDCR